MRIILPVLLAFYFSNARATSLPLYLQAFADKYPPGILNAVARLNLELRGPLLEGKNDPEFFAYPASDFRGVSGALTSTISSKTRALFIGVPIAELSGDGFTSRARDFAKGQLLAFREFRDQSRALARAGVEVVLGSTLSNAYNTLLLIQREITDNPRARKITVFLNENPGGRHTPPAWRAGRYVIYADIAPKAPAEHVLRLDQEFMDAPVSCPDALEP